MTDISEKTAFSVRLYLDEDIHESLLPALRQYGYDVVNVREVDRRGLSDAGSGLVLTGVGCRTKMSGIIKSY